LTGTSVPTVPTRSRRARPPRTPRPGPHATTSAAGLDVPTDERLLRLALLRVDLPKECLTRSIHAKCSFLRLDPVGWVCRRQCPMVLQEGPASSISPNAIWLPFEASATDWLTNTSPGRA